MGGAGNDTANFTGVLNTSKVDGGAGVSLISASADLISSTLLGGASNDTFNLTGSGVTTSRVIAGGGADVINFSGSVTGASIVGGAGNDSVVFDLDSAVNAAATGNTNDAVTNTYFFGSGGGA